MKSCPFCGQPVADATIICPHSGCGKRLPVAVPSAPAAPIRRPPPPGAVKLAPGGKVQTIRPVPAPPVQAGASSADPPRATPAAPAPPRQPPPPGPVNYVPDTAPVSPAQNTSEGSRLGLWLVLAGALAVPAVLGLWLVYTMQSAADSETSKKTNGSRQMASAGAAGTTSSTSPTSTSPASPEAAKKNPGGGKAQSPPKPDAAKDPAKTVAEGEKKPDAPGAATTVQTKPESIKTFGIYAARTPEKRKELLDQYGGNTISEQTVTDGLEWLARHQASDGHWGADCIGRQGQCEADGPCTGPGQQYSVAQTGLALLAFQAGGHYDFNRTKYSPHVAKGIKWLVEHQRQDGLLIGSWTPGQEIEEEEDPGLAGLFGPGKLRPRGARPSMFLSTHFMYEHGIGTFALAEACAVAIASGQPPDEKSLAAATKAVKYIESIQHNDGGWRYSTSKNEGSDTSVSGWQVLALKTAMNARIPVAGETVDGVREFFKRCEARRDGRTGYTGPSPMTEATTGVGMLVHQFLLKDPDSQLVQDAAPFLADYAERTWGGGRGNRPDGARGAGPRGRSDDDTRRLPRTAPPWMRTSGQQPDYYLWYNCTLAMFQAGGQPWKRWNDVVRDEVIALQEKGDACTRGSWRPDDRWGMTGGRIYSTALAVLTLEVYYRFAREQKETAKTEPSKRGT